MSETSYLGLFKHDNPETNMDKFDIDKALNQNWDKIDRGLQDAVSEFTAPISYKGQVATLNDLPSSATRGDVYSVVSENKNYIWNGTAWVEYASTIDLSYLEDETKTNMQSGTAKELELTDSANAIASFNKIEGDTYQATRDGRNLVNVSSVSNLTLDAITKEVTISSGFTGSGFIIWDNTPTLTANKTYLIEFYLSSTTTNTRTSTINLRDANGSLIGEDITINNSSNYYSISYTPTSNVNPTRIQIYFGTSTPSTGDIVLKAQIRENTTTSGYEDYGVSPSPDYPSDIRNVGDNINLLNLTDRTETTSHDLTFSAENGILNINGTCSSGFGFTLGTIPKIKKGTYTLGTNSKGSSSAGAFGLYLYDSSNNQLFDSGNIANNFNTTKQITLSQDYENVSFTCYISGTTKLENITFKPKIEEGTQQTGFSPYNCGSIDFTVCNKNLCKNVTISGSNQSSINFEFNPRLVKQTIKISFTTNVELSSNSLYLNIDGVSYGIIDRITANANAKVKRTITFSNVIYNALKNGYTATLNIYKSNAGFTLPNDAMIENSSSYTDYVPHQEQTIQFPLASGQLLHEGDYLADDGIHSTRITLTFDGTETEWSVRNLSFVYSKTLGKKLRDIGISSHFIPCTDSTWNSNDTQYRGKFTMLNESNTIKFMPTDEIITTTELWKTWLVQQYANGTPVTVEYALAEEIVTPYTTEQQEAYYQLQHALMYKGYTLIECIDNMKPDIQVNYLYNNKVNNYYGNIIYELENRLHQLENS